MENIMVAGAFGHATNYGSDGHFKENDEVLTSPAYSQSFNISEQYTLAQSSCKGLLFWQTLAAPYQIHLISKWPPRGKNWRELHKHEVIRVKCLFRTALHIFRSE